MEDTNKKARELDAAKRELVEAVTRYEKAKMGLAVLANKIEWLSSRVKKLEKDLDA